MSNKNNPQLCPVVPTVLRHTAIKPSNQTVSFFFLSGKGSSNTENDGQWTWRKYKKGVLDWETWLAWVPDGVWKALLRILSVPIVKNFLLTFSKKKGRNKGLFLLLFDYKFLAIVCILWLFLYTYVTTWVTVLPFDKFFFLHDEYFFDVCPLLLFTTSRVLLHIKKQSTSLYS